MRPRSRKVLSVLVNCYTVEVVLDLLLDIAVGEGMALPEKKISTSCRVGVAVSRNVLNNRSETVFIPYCSCSFQQVTINTIILASEFGV